MPILILSGLASLWPPSEIVVSTFFKASRTLSFHLKPNTSSSTKILCPTRPELTPSTHPYPPSITWSLTKSVACWSHPIAGLLVITWRLPTMSSVKTYWLRSQFWGSVVFYWCVSWLEAFSPPASSPFGILGSKQVKSIARELSSQKVVSTQKHLRKKTNLKPAPHPLPTKIENLTVYQRLYDNQVDIFRYSTHLINY